MIICTHCANGFLYPVIETQAITELDSTGIKEVTIRREYDECSFCFATFNVHIVKVERDK